MALLPPSPQKMFHTAVFFCFFDFFKYIVAFQTSVNTLRCGKLAVLRLIQFFKMYLMVQALSLKTVWVGFVTLSHRGASFDVWLVAIRQC